MAGGGGFSPHVERPPVAPNTPLRLILRVKYVERPAETEVDVRILSGIPYEGFELFAACDLD